MCGICGIVDFERPGIEAETVDQMRDLMVNRGPDDAGTVVLPHAGLGHRRLSIIDLSPNGRQPMTNEDRSVWLVFNGEIYDFEPLQRELAAAGHRFESNTDSEVLVHGYEEWGIEGLAARLNGMFAFAIWDVRRRQLCLVRDRLGKKPLYYGYHEGRFTFASDLKALWALAPGRWKVRPDSIARFLYWGYLPGRDTIYEGIYQVLPARILTITSTGVQQQRYWRLSFASKIGSSPASALDEAESLLTAAVRRRLRSDVPLGAFLSGGVDSSCIVSMMAEASRVPVKTFAMGTSDPAHDERSFARQVAVHCGTVHTEFEITPDVWTLLPRLVWEFGQPFADAACIPTYHVAACARAHVTVALTGDGGDEAFAGYSQHQGRYLGAILGHFTPTGALDSVMTAMNHLIDNGGDSRLESAARFLRYAHEDPVVSWSNVSLWTGVHLKKLLSPPYRALTERDVLLGYALEVAADFDGRSALDRALHFDYGMLLPFCYNVKVDVATMMSSLEARCPFQDRDLVEWAAKLPPGVKMRPWSRKALLKRLAARRLPREVVYRPKHGFSLPVDAWFRGPWAPAARQILFSDRAMARGFFDYAHLERLWSAHAERRANHGDRFWALLWLELWQRRFIDDTATPTGGAPAASAASASARHG